MKQGRGSKRRCLFCCYYTIMLDEPPRERQEAGRPRRAISAWLEVSLQRRRESSNAKKINKSSETAGASRKSGQQHQGSAASRPCAGGRDARREDGNGLTTQPMSRR